MQPSSHPIVKDIVLVGAGHAHVQVLREFAMAPLPGVRLTLITREVHTPYSGMLPGLIAGHYSFDEAHIDTAPLARFANARLCQDEVVGLDLEGRRVLCRARPPVPYDLLSLNIGSTPNTAEVAGAAEHAIPVKPIDGFLERFEALRARVIAAPQKARIAVVGSGAGGVELILSLERRLRTELARAERAAAVSFVLLTDSDDILRTFPVGFRARFSRLLAARGIEVMTGSAVARLEPGELVLASGARVKADEVLWTTQARPAPWLAQTGLVLDAKGFIRTDVFLRAQNHANVYAAGDTIAFPGRDLPRSGVYAVRAGQVLAENLRCALTGVAPKQFRPQKQAMYLVSTGERRAIGARNGLVFEGDWVWRWKNRIDVKFMRMFADFPEIPEPAAPGSPLADKAALGELSSLAMRCGGCGAKVGLNALGRSLTGINPIEHPGVIVGLKAADDAAVVDTGGPLLSVHTVDYFRAMIDDPWLFGKIAANHALGDIFAMGAEPRTALAIATMPYGLESKVEADLAAMMAGANDVLREAGCALVGGHTSEGAELALGFAVNGAIAREQILRKSGLRPGDALILTKPLGTGALLAAHMRGRAKARWVVAALALMIQSSGRAAQILRENGARAMTDVTGFGLVGHLVEMLRASGVDAQLDLARVPLLEGVIETLQAGIYSSLQPQNLRLRRAIANHEAAAVDPRFPALFDPQTAGGLLAALPAARAAEACAALIAAGYAGAVVIGRVTARSGDTARLSVNCGDA